MTPKPEPRRWQAWEITGAMQLSRIHSQDSFVEASAYDAMKAERDASLEREAKLLAALGRLADPWDIEINSCKLAREAIAEHEKGGTK